jgi:hypothetical protein
VGLFPEERARNVIFAGVPSAGFLVGVRSE